MHNKKNTESTPLLGAAAGPIRDLDLGLGDRRRRTSRRGRHAQPPGGGAAAAAAGAGAGAGAGAARGEDDVPNAVRRNWRVSAGVAGVLIVVVALTGLVTTFSIAQLLQRQQKTDTAAAAAAAAAAVAASAAPESRHSNTRVVAGGIIEEDEMEVDTSSQPKAPNQTKPNVFFILIDDMGWNDIGYQTNDLQGVTPNLDKLAAGGVKITNYYTMELCTPSRACLMTGRYALRYGLQTGVLGPMESKSLPLTEKIFPEYMKDAGYATHMVGKWHLGSYAHSVIPSQRGFDTFLGYLNAQETYWSHQNLANSMDGLAFFDFGFGNATGYYDIMDGRRIPEHAGNGSLSGDNGDDDEDMLSSITTSSSSLSPSGNGTFIGKYSTQVFQERAIEILEQKTPFDEEPLYMYLAHQAVHLPLGLPPKGSFSEDEMAILDAIKANSSEGGHLRQRFAKVLMYLDHTIGDLVDYLETEGWMENSIIVVTSDNGGCPLNGGSAYPLRGTKGSSFEGGNKVPAFVYSTSHIPEERWGTEYDGMMHVTDWLPTIASGAGIDLQVRAALDGIDHWDYIVNNTKMTAENDSPRQEIMYNLQHSLKADADDPIYLGVFRSGKYKYLSNVYCLGWNTFDKHTLAHDPLTNTSNVCDGSTPCDACSDMNFHDLKDHLFDLEADPREENDLIEVYPEIAETLRNRWMEVAFSEWGKYTSMKNDEQAKIVWANHNWWMLPWWNLVHGVTDSTTSAT